MRKLEETSLFAGTILARRSDGPSRIASVRRENSPLARGGRHLAWVYWLRLPVYEGVLTGPLVHLADHIAVSIIITRSDFIHGLSAIMYAGVAHVGSVSKGNHVDPVVGIVARPARGAWVPSTGQVILHTLR
jgi:hypothetical protein